MPDQMSHSVCHLPVRWDHVVVLLLSGRGKSAPQVALVGGGVKLKVVEPLEG
jgi:hypothetical protein